MQIKTGNRNFSVITSLKAPLLSVVMIFIVHLNVMAQFYNGSNLTFGKNRVQFNEFYWTYYKFEDLDTYFYLNGKELAQYAARYATEQIPIMEAKTGTILDKRLQFIIFNNLTDLKQSNIGLITEDNYNVGGVTHIIGSKVFIYFDGNHLQYEKQIRSGIAQVLFNQLMFGGTLGQQVKTAAVFSVPDWYKEGLISWLGDDWSVETDNIVRDGILSGRYDKLNNLQGEDAVHAGHSFWRFIALTYGNNATTNIIQMTAMSNSIDKGVLYVTGMSFKQLVSAWRDYYLGVYSPFPEVTSMPTYQVNIRYKNDVSYLRPTLNPDGTLLAYTTNEMGKYKIFLLDLETGKRKKILSKGVMMDTKVDYSYPLMAWHPTGKLLGIVIEDKGMPWLYFYNLEEKKFTRQILYNVQKVNSIKYSKDGRRLVVSANQKGQSDIFIFDIPASSWIRITDDIYSDLDPAFLNHDSEIVFSSNRVTDTIGLQEKPIVNVPDQFDLFIYNLKTGDKVLRRITNTPVASEVKPIFYGEGAISYLSNENGVLNQYVATIDSAVSAVDTAIHYRYFTHSKAVTNYTYDIQDHSVSTTGSRQVVAYMSNQQTKFFIDDALPYQKLNDLTLPITPYMTSLLNSYQEESVRMEKLQALSKTLVPGKSREEKVMDTTTSKVTVKRPGQFVMVYMDKDGAEILGSGTYINDDGVQVVGIVPGLGGPPKGADLDIPKRLNYNVSYFINNVVSQVDFNYINYGYQPFTGGGSPIYLNPGFNLFFQVGVTDLMEDHRIVGGVRLNLNLINNEYLFSYSNLKKRLDQEIVFHRNTIENYYGYYLYRVHSHELFYTLKWPFNEALSVSGTFQYRNEMYNFLAMDQPSLETPNTYVNWGGLLTQLVFDNTRSLGTNLLLGTRYKIFAEYNMMFAAVEKNKLIKLDQPYNLFVLGADIRHYTRIHRNFIWANRIAGSTSFGDSPLIYYMGGVDNWLFPKFNTNTPIDYEQNYAYQTLATNLRGFNQNIRNGNSFVVLNTELRFPIFQYFSKTPLSSGFLRTFQLIGFGDVGTAWTGWSPYSKENALYTNYVDSGPMHISVEVQKEPVVAGFGLGARTTLFGYFVRGDVAWGLDDYHTTQPVYYLSLSLDF